MSGRPSLPPGPESLEKATAQLKASNDRLEARVGAAPLLTREQRLAVAAEIWNLGRETGASDGFRLLIEYERRVKERGGG